MISFLSLENFNLSQLFPQSSADTYISGNNLNIKFNLVTTDLPKARAFATELGVSSDFFNGISLGLDEQTINKLSTSLPAHVSLKIEPKKLIFNSPGSLALSSTLVKNKYQFATGSGKLNLVADGDGRDYNLDILDPEPLVRFATNSGQLSLSTKFNPLLQLAPKIAKIEVRVSNKSISGKIELK